MGHDHRKRLAACAVLAALAGGCSRNGGDGPPPRANDPVPQPRLVSLIAVPIDADPRGLTTAVERAVPRTLWTIDRRIDRCVPPREVKVFGRKIATTPAVPCTVTGAVTRGPIRLRGQGQDIVADIPINARITARDVGRVLKGETATGSAMAHVRIAFDIAPDWTPRAKVDLNYDWTTPPGIDFLGQRIAFTEQADEKLGPVVRDLERSLPAEIARLDLRRQVEGLWRRGFTTISLNQARPPVWMRITPQKLRYGRYSLNDRSLRLNLAIEAVTETFVGHRPADPAPTPLPPLAKGTNGQGLRFFLPVIADYAVLEPVILRALHKRSQRPFDIPGADPLMASFEKVQTYGTTGNRIAVGLTLTAWPADDPSDKTRGVIWVAAQPVNAPGSARVSFTNLTLSGDTDGVAGDTLLAIGQSPALSEAIAGALGQNFTKDLAELLAKVRTAIADKPVGDFAIQARIDQVQTGRISAFGQGLYLPVRVSGDARINYQPKAAPARR